jgi:hypothetical protein
MAEAVPAVWYLLKTNASLIATVPAARIFSGVIPEGTAAPTIAVNHVSTVRRNTISGSGDRLCTSRIQVTVHADTYPNLRAVMALVRAALPRSVGTTVNGTDLVAILVDGEGPDFRNDSAGLYMRSQDFMVTFNE